MTSFKKYPNFAATVHFLTAFAICQVNAVVQPTEPRGPFPGTPSPPGSPWPLPQEWSSAPEVVSIGLKENFRYESNVANCEPLVWAFDKLNYDFLFGSSATPDESVPILNVVRVYISLGAENQCNANPKLDTNKSYESYELSIRGVGTSASVFISATTVWGAIRGLETFTQLVYDEPDGKHFYANVTTISDWPRFPHRGVMLDTSRHYLPERIIHQVLDGMYFLKFNVFHWHMVDDHSFPFVSERFPTLSQMGAFNNKSIYTPAAVKRVLEAARMRGIRVIFEFDSPGHTNSWGRAFPELLTPCYGDGETPGTPNYPEHAPYENLDPTKEFTYELTKSLFEEVHEVSYDDYIHLGMDEVYMACWNSSPVIHEFMAAHGYESLSEVQGHFTRRVLENVINMGAKPIIWQDPLDEGVEVPTDVIIQMWKGWGIGWENYTQLALDAGYKVIISAPWYLNYISYGEPWRYYYEQDPILNLPNITPEQEENVLGGEACLWGELADKTNLVSRLFPNAGAVAERLWSAPDASTTDDALYRLDQQRCRMLRWGIPSQPLWCGYCGPWEAERDEL